jgi:spermidine synthase
LVSAAEHDRPYVREELGTRSLHFSMAQTQSCMQLQRPQALELEYTCTMMGFLMVRPGARRLAMIGLGGGSIAKFCHRYLTRASLVVVELNPSL